MTVYTFIALFVVLGVVILAGKGDFLIAGYNTASKEERDKVNIKRLRLLIAVLLFLCGALKPLLALDELTGGYCLCCHCYGSMFCRRVSG